MAKKRNTRLKNQYLRCMNSEEMAWFSFALCFVGLCVLIIFPCRCDSLEVILTFIIGIIGIAYCCHYSKLWFCRPIERDYLLRQDKFFLKVCCFVLYVPFVFAFLLLLFNCACQKWSNEPVGSESNQHAKEMFYIENVYAPDTTYIAYSFDVQNDSCFGDTLTSNDTLASIVRYATLQTYAKIQGLQANDTSYIQVDRDTPIDVCGKEEPNLFWSVYMHFMDPGNQHMVTSRNGRGWAAAISILGLLLLNGLLVSTLVSYFDRRKENWKNGDVRYKAKHFKGDFAVVIGNHNSAPVIVRDLIRGKGEKPVDYVVLLSNEKAQDTREKIESYLNKEQRSKLIIYNGQLDSREELASLHLHKATEIYVLGENKIDDVSNSYHDTQNMKCVHLMAEILKGECEKADANNKECEEKKNEKADANKNENEETRLRITCHVLFEYQTIYSVFQFSDVSVEVKKYLDFIPFSNYEDWAQCVFVHNHYDELDCADSTPRPIDYFPLDEKGISSESKNHVHLVVVDMSKMGIAMALQAAQVAHYPNFKVGDKEKNVRTRITFIDKNADEEMNFFKGRYRNMFDLARHRYLDASGLGQDFKLDVDWINPMQHPCSVYRYMGETFIDIEWEFIKGSVEYPNVVRYLTHAATEENTHLTVAICLPNSAEALAAALYMPDIVHKNALQVLVYQRESSHIVYNLKHDGKGRYAKLRPFGMDTANFTMHDVVKQSIACARYCAKTYSLMFDNKFDNQNINSALLSLRGNEAGQAKIKAEWADGTKVCDKWSNQYLANSFATKMRSVAVAGVQEYRKQYDAIEANKEMLAQCEHNRWNVQQLLMGFRACTQGEAEDILHGKVSKDDLKKSIKKAHYNLCSFADLTPRDPKAQGYDELFNRAIPAILQVVASENGSGSVTNTNS